MTRNMKATEALFWAGVILAGGSLILLLVRVIVDSLTPLAVLAHLLTLASGLVLMWQHRRATKKP